MRYAKRVVIGGEVEAPSTGPSDFAPVTVAVKGLENIPPRHPSGRFWDIDGSAPDLRLILFADGKERGRSEVFHDVMGSVQLEKVFQIMDRADETRLSLELWDVDVPAPELVGRLSWTPGKLRPGVVTETTEEGLRFELEISAPNREHLTWDPEPFYLLQ